MTVGSLIVKIGANITELQAGLSKASQSIEKVGKKMEQMGKTMSVRVTAPIAAFGALALRTAGNFESSMNRVAAISQATGKELSDLEGVARSLGATTQFSASQAADAMTFLAMAGFKVNEITQAMPSVLNLAAAAQLDMASAADIASNIMSGFNMTADELGGAVDVLAKSFTSANTDLSQLGGAMKMVGPVAQGFGIRFEEAAAAVGFLGDAGIQGTAAGTGLRRILTVLSSESDKLGVNVWDASGNMRGLADIFEDLEKKGLSSAKIMEIFGDRGGPAMQVLLSQGSSALRNMTGELDDAGGTAQRIADTNMEGLNGALKALRSAFEELQIAIAKSGLLEFATRFAERTTKMIQGLSKLNPSFLKFATVIAGLTAAIGPLLFIIGKLILSKGTMATAIGAITFAVKGLTAAMIANPFTAIAIGLTTIGLIAFSSHKRMKSLREETERLLDLDISDLGVNELDAQILDVANTIDKLDKASFSLFGYDFEKKNIEGLQLELSELIKKRNELVSSQGGNPIIPPESSKSVDDLSVSVDDLSVAFKGLNERISENQKLIDAVINNSENITKAQVAEVRELTEKNEQLEHEIYLRRLLLGLEKPKENVERVDLTEQLRMVGIQDMLAGKMQLVNTEAHKLPEAMRDAAESMGQVSAMSEFAHNIAMNFTSSFGQGMANVVVQGEKLVDVLKNIGKLLLSSAIQFGIQAFLTGGLGSGAGFFGKGGGLMGKIFGVNDALITSGGDVVKFHKNDNILAMKDFSGIGGGGGSQRVEVYGTIKGQDLFISSQRGSTSFNR